MQIGSLISSSGAAVVGRAACSSLFVREVDRPVGSCHAADTAVSFLKVQQESDNRLTPYVRATLQAQVNLSAVISFPQVQLAAAALA